MGISEARATVLIHRLDTGTTLHSSPAHRWIDSLMVQIYLIKTSKFTDSV